MEGAEVGGRGVRLVGLGEDPEGSVVDAGRLRGEVELVDAFLFDPRLEPAAASSFLLSSSSSIFFITASNESNVGSGAPSWGFLTRSRGPGTTGSSGTGMGVVSSFDEGFLVNRTDFPDDEGAALSVVGLEEVVEVGRGGVGCEGGRC